MQPRPRRRALEVCIRISTAFMDQLYVDWSVNLKILDPSSPAKVGSNDLEAFGINCFTKQHISWLPQPNAGDVLMLRRVQVTQSLFCYIRLLTSEDRFAI